jgi:hypothetical protein
MVPGFKIMNAQSSAVSPHRLCLLREGVSFLVSLSTQGFEVLNDHRCMAPAIGALLFVLFAAPASAATIPVPAGGDLQAALEAAQPGDVVALEPGATYTGNFRLPLKNGAEFIVLRTVGSESSLPAPGVRVHKMHAPMLAKIQSGNTSPALATVPGAHHWRVELIEFLANRNGSGDIIALGGGSTQTDVSQMPHTLVFDRVYVHGDPTTGQKRGIALNSGNTHIVNSYFEDFKSVSQETQAIACWNGAGPFVIENNYTESAGPNLIFGGADPSIPNLVPSDITVRRNVFTKPLAWRSERWQVKNAFELKNARRVLVEGNVFENVWQAAQAGHAVLLTVRNQDGRGPWAVVEDVTFQYNIIRHVSAAINILGYDDRNPSGQTRRLRISNNLVYDVDRGRWGGTGDFILMGAMPRDLYIENNTVFHSGMAMNVYGGRTPTGGVAVEGVVFRNNTFRHNQYGVKGDGSSPGIGTFARYLPGIVFETNVLAGGSGSQYPAGNYFPSVAEFEAQFVDPARENFALVPGSMFGAASASGGALGADLGTMSFVMSGGFIFTPQAPTPPGDEDQNSINAWRRRGGEQ